MKEINSNEKIYRVFRRLFKRMDFLKEDYDIVGFTISPNTLVFLDKEYINKIKEISGVKKYIKQKGKDLYCDYNDDFLYLIKNVYRVGIVDMHNLDAYFPYLIYYTPKISYQTRFSNDSSVYKQMITLRILPNQLKKVNEAINEKKEERLQAWLYFKGLTKGKNYVTLSQRDFLINYFGLDSIKVFKDKIKDKNTVFNLIVVK